MPFSLQPSMALGPFSAFVDPSAALAAHVRLAVTLAERCVLWSPLDKRPSRLPAEDETEDEEAIAVAAAPLVDPVQSLDLTGRLWP